MTKELREEFFRRWKKISSLESALALFAWDQETYMPKGAVSQRAEIIAHLNSVLYTLVTDPYFVELLDSIEEEGKEFARHARVARIVVDRYFKVPAKVRTSLAYSTTLAVEAWKLARKEGDFSIFEKELDNLLKLKKEEASCLKQDDTSLYEALLNLFEPGITEKVIDSVFERLIPKTYSLLDKYETNFASDKYSVFEYSPDKQWEAAAFFASAVGLRLETDSRLDLSTHPMCIAVTPCDVRITFRYRKNDFRSSVFGVLHEAGHALYELGIDESLFYTPLGKIISLGLHESQSRLWENFVGRRKEFWSWGFYKLKELFPFLEGGIEEWVKYVNQIKRSLIRVEADIVSYNLHVFVRYLLEKELINENLTVKELPTRWNELYKEIVGVVPGNVSEGVLQDIHWAAGLFGYFPTYTLGSLSAAQFYNQARKEITDLEETFQEGKFSVLLDWLRKKVHSRGAATLQEVLLDVTDKGLGVECFINEIERLISH